MNGYIYHSGGTPYIINLIEEIKKLGVSTYPRQECDFFLALQMGQFEQLRNLAIQNSSIPFINYIWDCYEWVWDYPMGMDWAGLGALAQISVENWVPSVGQCKRVEQHWGLTNTKVIPAYGVLFDHDNVRDDNYVCNPLRDIPDKHRGWIEQACQELKIPYQHGGRGHGSIGRTWDEYKDWLAGASFIVCPWYEASTGGMSLIEGYNLGKEVLICNSPYMGAKDYFGNRANYFEPNYESLKNKIKLLWESRFTFPSRPLEEKQKFCKENHSITAMAKNIVENLERVINND